MMLDPAVLARIREIARDVRAQAGDDDTAQADTLEGATDAMELLDALIEASQHAASLEAAARERAQRITERARRMAEQDKGYRRAMACLLDAMDLKRVVRPCATLSIKPGSLSVRIDSPADIPTQLRKPGEPDKAAIKAQIEAGVEVPGASLERGAATISMRAT